LRRRLAEEGTSFRQLTRAQRCAAARALLADPALPVKGVAAELGFSDATAFHRAFRRWCERTPAQYRAALAGSSTPLR
jgi:AraC-like DNA-binding protein